MRAVLPLFVLLVGCDDTIFGPGKKRDTDTLPITAPVYADVQTIFTDACTSCHAGAAPAQDLDLTAGHDAIVAIPSTEVPSMVLVLPDDTANSYLWLKLQGTASVGAKMPLSGSLSDGDLGTIENWINEGAP